MRSTLLAIESNPNLKAETRDQLETRLRAALRDISTRGRAIEHSQAELAQLVAVAEANEQRANLLKSEQNRFDDRFQVYGDLMNAGRLEELAYRDILAGMIELQNEAKTKGLEAQVSTTSLYYTAMARYNLERQYELKKQRNQNFLEVLLRVEKAGVPLPDEPPIHFPPLKTWQAISKIRKDRYDVSSLPDDPEARREARKIHRLLKEEMDMTPFQIPMKLKEVLGLMYEKLAAKGTDLPILVDTEAFKADNPDAGDIYDTQVQFPGFPKKMAISTALRLALSQIPTQNATYIIRRNRVEITTAKRVTEDKVLRVYPVGQLTMPISGGMGMGGMG